MSLTNPMKVLLALIVSAIIMLGFWILDWQAKQQTLSQAEATLTEKKAELEKMKVDVKQIDKLNADNNELKQELKKVMEAGIVPEDASQFVANYIEQISNLVQRIKVEDQDPDFELLSLTPGSQQTTQVNAGGAKPGGASPAPGTSPSASGAPAAPAAAPAAVPDALKAYPTRTFQMSMKGKYETLIGFLDRLGHLELQRLVTVNKLSLSPSGDVKVGSPVLSITMPLTAYLRTGGDQQ